MSSGFDANDAPTAALARNVLSAIHGDFVNVYIGGYEMARTDWSPELVREYAAAGITQFLPTYVGSQTGDVLTYDQGVIDGHDTIACMTRFGWPHSHYVALDVEEPTSRQNLRGTLEYIRGWMDGIERAPLFGGVYGSAVLLNVLQAVHSKAAFTWLADWIRYGYDPHLTNHQESDYGIVAAGAWPKHRVWQYCGGTSIYGVNVDLDIANFTLNPPPS